MWIAFLIVGLLLFIGGAGYGGYKSYLFVKEEKRLELDKKENLTFVICHASIGAGFAFLQAAINTGNAWAMSNFGASLSIVGALFFGASLSVLVQSFYIHYWKPTQKEEQRVWWTRILYISIFALILGFLMLGEGVAPYLTYPLVNGFSINNNGWVWTTFQNGAGGFHVAFYGVFIILGALVSYWISDHKMYQKFGVHGIMDTTLIFGLAGGIIGARVGYVIGNWNGDVAGGVNFSEEVAKGNWVEIFKIWNGGLTILGGAIGGILVGSLYFQWRHKSIGVRTGMDVAVPTILLAQAVGRWGNFFNHEVYGAAVERSSLSFLPSWIQNQMATAFNGGQPATSQMYVPLFLIEGLINVIGYFLIVYGVGKLLKKWLHRGDLCGFYLIWYGVVRAILEPLRDSTYHMGSNGFWSNAWSFAYIGIGIAFIAFMHLYDYLRYTKKGLAIPTPMHKGVLEYGKSAIAPKEVVVEEKKEETPSEAKDEPLPIGDEALALDDPEDKEK